MKKRETFTREFKLEAVRLLEEGKIPPADLARELQEEIGEISEKYTPDNYPIERFSISPRRSDIFDVQVSLQWEPEMNLPPIQ